MYYIYNLVSYLCWLNYIIRIFNKLVIVSIDNGKNVSTWYWRVSTFYSWTAAGRRYPFQSWQTLPYNIQVSKIPTSLEEKFDRFLLRGVSSKALDNFCSAGWSEFQQTVKNVQFMKATLIRIWQEEALPLGRLAVARKLMKMLLIIGCMNMNWLLKELKVKWK